MNEGRKEEEEEEEKNAVSAPLLVFQSKKNCEALR